MPRLIVLYPIPRNPQEFETAYHEEHEPLVRAQLGTLRGLTASKVVPVGEASAPFYWMVELRFDSMDALKTAVASDGGLRAGAHARQISTGGPPTMFLVDDGES